nr:immunoglobulin heavy chain junction region [Macaca mulatta]MOV90479.1 immunoglobulin heavy chain junction region [Macaca mulatta]
CARGRFGYDDTRYFDFW